MRLRRTARFRAPRERVALGGLVAGAIAGTVTVSLVGTAVAVRSAGTVPAAVEVAHLPPLLTATGEPVDLEYDVHCVSPLEFDADRPCDARGTVFVRPGDRGPFRTLALTRGIGGRLVAAVPDEIVQSPSGFSYYAVIEDAASSASTSLPAAGPAAPQRSYPMDHPVEVALGAHRFGLVREESARVAEAQWGDGAADVGLEQGLHLTAIGGSALDVGRDGSIYVLDEANRRILRWSSGQSIVEPVELAIDGTLADLAVADDETIHVLETTAEPGRKPLLRSFTRTGTPLGATEIAERSSQLRLGPADDPFALQHPSGQWMRLAGGDRSFLPPRAQVATGRAGRPLPAGGEVIVLSRESEVRVALVNAGRVRQAWRVTSETPLAEVQLAEMQRNMLVLVVRSFTDARDEFVVLVLDGHGVVDRFSVDSADWAETAPLSRFRAVGGSLYQLGSTPNRLFVDRYDLDVSG